MLKYITAAITILFLISGNAQAQEKSSNAANKNSGNQQHFPVIIQNEVISSGICRLHYENGTSREVSCKETKKEMT